MFKVRSSRNEAAFCNNGSLTPWCKSYWDAWWWCRSLPSAATLRDAVQGFCASKVILLNRSASGLWKHRTVAERQVLPAGMNRPVNPRAGEPLFSFPRYVVDAGRVSSLDALYLPYGTICDSTDVQNSFKDTLDQSAVVTGGRGVNHYVFVFSLDEFSWDHIRSSVVSEGSPLPRT